jgi:hypothetical protein
MGSLLPPPPPELFFCGAGLDCDGVDVDEGVEVAAGAEAVAFAFGFFIDEGVDKTGALSDAAFTAATVLTPDPEADAPLLPSTKTSTAASSPTARRAIAPASLRCRSMTPGSFTLAIVRDIG